MVEVTPAATEQIGLYFKGRDPQPIRIFLNEGGWGGPSLAMALDEQRDEDEVYDVEGYKYLVDKIFLEKAKPIKVDYQVHGFKLDCGIDFGADGGCSGCGSDSSGCG